MKKILYIYILFSIYSKFLFSIPFVLGGGGVWSSDLLVVFAIVIIIVQRFITRKSILNEYRNGPVNFIIIVLVIMLLPILRGIIMNHTIGTIFRDARFLPHYSFALLIPIIIKNLDDYLSVFKFIKVNIVINILLFFLMFFMDVSFDQSLGMDVAYDIGDAFIKRYGVSTATFYYPILLFIILSSLLRGGYSSKRRYLQLILFGMLVFAIFYYAMRSFIIGVLVALLFEIVIFWKFQNSKKVALIIITAILLLFTFQSIPNTLLDIPQIRRLYATIDPSVSNSGTYNNMLVRIEAIHLAIEENYNVFLGNGFGDKPTFSQSTRNNLARWWNHSSIAFIIHKMGYIISIILSILFTSFLIFSLRYIKVIKMISLRSIAFGFWFFLISAIPLAAGTNNFFRGDFFTMEISLSIGLILAAIKINKFEKI